MTGTFARLGLPLFALVAGSWVGLGRPSGPRLRDELPGTLRERVTTVAARAIPPPAPVPLIEAPPAPAVAPLSPLGSTELPDPVPWPRLNAAANGTRAWLLAEGAARDARSGERFVTLTFDDGPSPETTPHILRALDRAGVRATFFLIGRYLDGDEPRNVQARALAKQIAAAGHLIGNHTHDHALLTSLTRVDALKQLERGALSIERATGKRPILFRPPYGGLDSFLEQTLARRGDELVMWSIEAGDMTRDDEAGLAESIISQIDYAEGGTVLLHDVRWVTVRALPKILAHLKKKAFRAEEPNRLGYSVVDLPTFLRAAEKSPQPFADRAALEKARSEQFTRRRREASAPRAEKTGPGV